MICLEKIVNRALTILGVRNSVHDSARDARTDAILKVLEDPVYDHRVINLPEMPEEQENPNR